MVQKILHMTGSLGYKGLEASVMNLYRFIDKNKFQFDFVVCSKEKELYDDEVVKMGGRIWRLPSRSNMPIKYAIKLFDLLKKNKYTAFHVHANSAGLFVDVFVAKLAGVKHIVIHSHNTSCIRLAQHRFFKHLLPFLSTLRIACSIEAAKWMFKTTKNCMILPNGIDPDKFRFNIRIRQLKRDELNIPDDSIVLGHVGSFNGAKNQEFVVDILKSLISSGIPAKLIFIGEGIYKKFVIEYSKSNSVYDNVIFLGARNDVNSLLNAFDFFVFPSNFEGMPLSPIEAQFAGLKCFLSTNVPNVTCLEDYVQYLPVNSGSAFWANAIKDELFYYRHDVYSDVINSSLDINNTTIALQKFYEQNICG